MDSANLILGAMITPAMAYAGLAAAALPVLIHLFNRRRFRRIRWAATDFLLEAERRNRRRTRLEEMILLALRCLAMALLGAALARWYVQPRSLVAALGASARTDHIIVLDDSYSMSALREGHDVAAGSADPDASDDTTNRIFHEARAAARQIVDHIRQVAPEDAVTVILASRPDRPVRSVTSVGQVPEQTWADDINALQPSSRAGNMPAALEAVRKLLDTRESTVRAAVYVISDFQAIDWIPASSGGADVNASANAGNVPTGPATALAGWMQRDRSLQLVLVDVGRTITSNLSVVAVRPDQPQAVAGVVGRYHVTVTNYGTEASSPREMRIFMGDTALPPVTVPMIAPNASVDVPVELAFGQPGSQRLTVQFEPDALPVDNVRSRAVAVERALRLLIVNGEASPDPYQDEAFLLNVALRPEGPEFSGNEVVVINEDEFEVADLADYHAVLLLNVNRVTHEMAGRLEQYAAAGGGVAFFLGDQVDAAVYNRLLYRGGAGVLPIRLGDQLSAGTDQGGLQIIPDDEAEARGLRFGSAAALLLRDARVWQHFSTTADTDMGAQASAPAGSEGAPINDDAMTNGATTLPQSTPADRPSATVLLRLDDADRTPLLIERPFGRGHVLLFASSADKEWNNLPDQPVYVVLMLELIQRVARSSEAAQDQLVGEPIRLDVDPAAYSPSAMLRLPTYPDTPAVRLEVRPNGENGQVMLEWANADRPGLYQFDLRRLDGEEVTRQVAVNLDPREGDLRRADRSALLATMGNLPVSYVTGDTLAEQARAEARQELWPLLLGVLVFVLTLEQGLAWWFGADRSWQRALRWTAS
ncbi:MAG TPA: BatA domain-containing protein [Phycisphaerae bacterium]|nr:BatA domain-containing protein [Phycisphaerae bacterium]HOM49801.1 BatA domain-containing protein [Phycisphaerae bacterium]HOQ84247.1 BatA domain-containing protein [Phycisphaerae bacterium]HPP25170.1 BatA domain-containing protein [Phycisphaerae bacterium]